MKRLFKLSAIALKHPAKIDNKKQAVTYIYNAIKLDNVVLCHGSVDNRQFDTLFDMIQTVDNLIIFRIHVSNHKTILIDTNAFRTLIRVTSYMPESAAYFFSSGLLYIFNDQRERGGHLGIRQYLLEPWGRCKMPWGGHFFIRFQAWGGYFFPVYGHGADTFFHGAETFLPLNLKTLMKLV